MYYSISFFLSVILQGPTISTDPHKCRLTVHIGEDGLVARRTGADQGECGGVDSMRLPQIHSFRFLVQSSTVCVSSIQFQTVISLTC